MQLRYVTIGLLLLACQTPANAQQDPLDRTRIQLPSAGPSNRVGVTGGRLTRDNSVVNPSSFRRRGGTGNPMRLPSNDELRRGRPLPPTVFPAAFQLGRVGFEPDYGAQQSIFRFQQPTTLARLQSVSGLSRSFNHGRPILDPPAITVRQQRAPYFASPRPATTFHDFFNLSPTEDEDVEEELKDPPSLDYADLLKAQNDEFRRRKREKALVEFKKGTTRLEERRYAHLTNSLDLFHGLRSRIEGDEADTFDRDIVLLSVHGYLEKGQVLSAGRSLLELVRNDPEFFLEKPEITKYFGDEATYTRVLRDNRRIGDQNPNEPIAFGLQAYCQWMLDDPGRAKEALKNMLLSNRGLGNDARIEALGVALQVALK